MNRNSAKAISILFNPVINPVIAFLLLIWANRQSNVAEKIELSGITASFACILIILCLLAFMRLGLINSPDIPDRQQRSFPLFIAAIILFAGFFALASVHASTLVEGLMWCYAVETLIVAIISYWWKISIHTASMACSLVALTFQFGPLTFLLYLLLPLVGQARIVLKKHTFAQVIAGALLGGVLTVIQLLVFETNLQI